MSARAQTARGYRLKPAPRSRSRGQGRRSRIQWDRVGRVALVLVLFAVLASYIGPTLNLFDAWRDSRTEHANLAELRTENQRLHERIANLDGNDAAELAARKQGMVGPTERPYSIRGLSR
ncbi:MAG TPA: septum formation initiator family protein [Solirubrobacterales bacterium]|nr:septum formation initiator family protein [Solirubrobacterales bacterium]